jgi:urease accessory protein
MQSLPRTRLLRSAALLAFVFPTLLNAHPGQGSGATAGLVHPFSGPDHLLAMIAIGLWASQIGGRAMWALPASFVGAMVLGAGLSSLGVGSPLAEPVILCSLAVVGVFIFGVVRFRLALACGLVAAFAVFHGLTHGAEMPAHASGFAYGAGFTLATVALHGLGLALGAWSKNFPAVALRFCGGSLALGGVGLMLS